MAEVIMICGRLCCGKTTYARRLVEKGNAALLSIDEIMLSMFGQHCGDKHEEYAARAEEYLLKKAAELINAGVDVIFDWGFWSREQRRRIRAYFAAQGIGTRLHVIHIPEAEWMRRIEKRNSEVLSGTAVAYYVDENLMRKFDGLFEEPAEEEADVNIYIRPDCTEN